MNLLQMNSNANVYIFPIPEIEQMIINYLDPVTDWKNLNVINKYFHNLTSRNQTFLELKEFCQKQTKYFYASRRYNKYDVMFWKVCRHGSIPVMEYLLNKYAKEIDIHSYKEYPFQLCCEFDHLNMAKRLYALSKTTELINIHADDEYAFLQSCRNQHMEIIKWLYQLSQENDNPINIRAHNDLIYKNSCECGRIEVVKWLQSTCPEYSYEIIKIKPIKIKPIIGIKN